MSKIVSQLFATFRLNSVKLWARSWVKNFNPTYLKSGQAVEVDIMLTNLQIERLKPQSKTVRYTDRDGLTLEVRPTGNKRFIFRFQWYKKPQTMVIGRFPSTSLADARRVAASYRSQLLLGIDPRAELSTSKPDIKTMKHVAELWLEKNKSTWRDATLKLHLRGIYRDILPVIGDKPIDDITKADLLRVIHPHEELKHYEIAHRLHDRLKAIFDYALAAGLTENYPLMSLKKALTPKPKIKNQVSINPNEAHHMLDMVKQSNAGKITKLYIELLAHLFTRPSELRLAKWCEFDLQGHEWNVPTERMKMDAPHWVPLTGTAIAILRELRLLTGFTTYVFNSHGSKTSKPISETSARKLLHNLGYKGKHTLHGFRALASTILHAESPFRSDAIEAQLAHKVQGVRGVYMRADFKNERRDLMKWYSEWLNNISCTSSINNSIGV